jgi:hypothetical protein
MHLIDTDAAGAFMTMKEGQVFRCQNRDCGCEIRVLRSSVSARGNPLCCCGAEMKRPYRKPTFRLLDSEVDLSTASETGKN